ncbi:BREX-1 system adenine-specific DNA-methyltransferase PglX [Lacticaseibacillus sp. N501-2]|uniref:BREX-1 system adenine-specific DNA-methyltransferase PglX n=1 Tax=Lacticaseibacillus salsurae TaxID=3367729 RepID=UPI0038B271B6
MLPGELHPVDSTLDLTSLHILDNAMGSGHILVYAFDVLMKIYEEQGYSQREAAQQIATSNLFGLEIDKRAYQLAYFAIMMKVRQYDRRALRRELKLNLYVFEDSKNLNDEFLAHLAVSDTDRADMATLRDLFLNAKTLGSIMHFEHPYDIQGLLKRLEQATMDSSDNLFVDESNLAQLRRMLNIVGIMQAHYEVVVTNPPYLNKMNKVLKDYVKKYYKSYSGDLFSVFIWLNINMTVKNGYAAYMTPFVWMFIKTYEALRINILNTKSISSLIQMEYSAFEEATVPINSFVLKNSREIMGSYIKLSDFKGGMNVQRDKVLEALSESKCKYLYRANQANFEKIPGSPIAYWASQNLIRDFEVGMPMFEIASPRVGLQTGDNSKFLRLWFEVAWNTITLHAHSIPESVASGRKWFPYNKGGAYRKWYGNYDYVVNWEKDGKEIRNFADNQGKIRSRPQNTGFYFREAITWSLITSGGFSIRYREPGSIHDVSGMSAYCENHETLLRILGLMSTPIADKIFKILNPTINLQVGDFTNFPVLSEVIAKPDSDSLISENIRMSKADWNNSETSWNYQAFILCTHIDEHNRNWTVEAAFNQWSKEAEDRFNQLKSNEEELNRIFIDLYGLQDELTPEVADKDVSVRKADRPRDIKAFLSYFVGVVFGRYSLDVPGLAFAGGEWNASKYKTFLPNKDDIILLTDEDYFDDDRDIIHRLKEFLTVTFGAEHLDENLAYVADSLDKKGDTPEAQIRKYFMDDFYKKDHLSTYQKRPIYWQLTSGKNNGFKALMYLHRYDENTLAMIRTTYLHPLQEAYVNRRTQLAKMIEVESNTRQRNQMTKSVTRLDKQIDEIAKYDTSLQHVANMHIVLDLDDGVLVNHEKAQGGQKLLSPLK